MEHTRLFTCPGAEVLALIAGEVMGHDEVRGGRDDESMGSMFV